MVSKSSLPSSLIVRFVVAVKTMIYVFIAAVCFASAWRLFTGGSSIALTFLNIVVGVLFAAFAVRSVTL